MKLKHFLKTTRFKSIALATAAIMAGSITAAADDFKTQDAAALEVINDFLGTEGQAQLNVSVSISLNKTTDGKDKFSYQLSGSNLSIQASSGVAACRAFYDFVKANGAGISTWSGKRFAMPSSVTKASQSEYTSPYRDHQYFNVVTYGYSTPYWDEARWDKELNWMALHGIDMPLMLVGSEQIYRKVFKELYNVTDADLNAWEVGPAHLPWMRMGNLAGNSFDGPLGDNWHNRQNQLAKHILKRMHELGMRPIVPAFGGFVPKAVAEQLDNFSTTGWNWIPADYKNYRLTPTTDGHFYNIGKKFIEEWDKEYESSYGEQFKYYLSDSFNEMTVPTDLNTLTGYGSQIYNAIKDGSGNADAVWVTQGWEFIYGSDKWFKGSTHASMFEALVQNVPDHNFMVLSMSPEYGGYGNKKWEEYNNYGGKEWNHTLLPNMGGKNFWTGVLNDYAQRFPTTLKNSPGNNNCTGWGMTMEGIEYNEMLYELIADMGWEANRTKDLSSWIEEYGNARFGNYTDELKALHTTLRNTVYTSYIDHQNFGWQGNGKTNGANKYYEGGNINTTNDAFFQGFETFFSAENIQKLKDGGKLSEPLRADLMEFAAFYGAARISKACTRIISLNNTGNKAQANLLINQLEQLMYDIDYALTGHPLYDEAKWEAKAEAMGDTQDTKDKYRKNARRIVSVWYGNHTGGYEPVNDYASRIWAGLMRDYYRPRLIEELRSVVNGTSVDLRAIERQFIPNGDVDTKAPALSTPKRTVDGVLTSADGITDATSDADLLDFLKVLVDEASEIGQVTIEKQKIEYSDFDENHWYYINSNNESYLDRALTVSNASAASGDLRVNALTGANSQIWRIIDNGDGTCRLENRDGQSFSWDGAPKTYIANIASDMVFELDEANTRYAILPQVLKGQTNCALHFNNSNGVPQAYGYKSGNNYYGGSVWTLAKADGRIEVTSDEDRARICRRINGFKADVWGDATLYGKPGQPNSAEAIQTAYTALSTRDLALETYSDYLLRYNQIIADNFNVPEDAQAHKLFDLILSAFQLNPSGNPAGKADLRTALITAQTALANGATGDAAKAQIAPLQTAIKAFIEGAANFPYVSAAPQGGKFDANSTVITLRCGNKNGYVTTAAVGSDGGLLLNNTTKPSTTAGYWVVSGDDTNGYSFYNVGEGAGKVLGFTGSEGNARAMLYDAASVASQSSVTYKFKYAANSKGGHVFYTGANNAWNNFGGNNILALWNNASTLTTDDGSSFTIETVEDVDLGETTGGGDVTPPTQSPTATITAVFPDGTKHIVYSDGTKLTAGATVPAGGISTFEVASRDEEAGTVVLKAGDKYLHMACGSDATGKMSDWDGLSESENAWTTLTLESANATGVSLDKRNGSTTVVGQWDAPSADLYQIKGMCSDNSYHYYILRSNDIWLGANSGDRFYDSNWNGDGTLRTSFFEVNFTEAVSTTLPLTQVEGVWVAPSLLDNGQFASNTVWYTLANKQTNQTGYISTAYTNNGFLATTNTTKDTSDAGLWCVIGDATNGYRFYNKAEGPTKVLSNNANTASGMVDATTTANTVFQFNERTAGSKIWNILDFGSTNNCWCGSNNQLGHWNDGAAATDNNCRWIFNPETAEPTTPVEPEPELGIFSTADNPVFWGLKFNNATAYISDKGEEELIETTGNFVTGWALIGNADSFKLLSTKGHYVGVKRATATNGQTDNLVYTLVDEVNAITFKLVNDNGSTFEIAQTSNTNKTFNPWGGKGAGKSIGFWTAGSADNVLVRVDIKDIEYFVASEGALAFNKPSKHTLWYNEPAPTDYNGWQEYSLPIGNGEFGGSIFGGVATDKITFNEKSLWDGNSSTRDNGVHGEYLKFGSIWVTDHSAGIADGVTDYVRYLDIDNAVAGVEYTGSDHNKYTRTFIASQPAKVLIGEYKASDNAKLDLTFSVVPGGQMVSRSTNKTPSVTYHEDGSATFDGKLELLSYAAQFTVKGDDGAVIEATDGGIRISNTSNVTLYVAGATDFDAWNNESGQFTNGHAAQLPAEVKGYIDAAAAKDFDALRAEATAEYRQWMDRVSFDLQKDGQAVNSDKTTKDLITAYTNNTGEIRNTAEGLFLEQLYYNYGRYLLISSNRYAPVPNNLQGLWVDTDSGHAPWNSDIHTNINIQMNYWPAEQNNLSELHMPLLNHIKSIASSPGCINQAKAKGATVGWVVDTESNLFGGMSNWMNNYTIANAWYCTHLWQHYRFTKDKQFLADYFPVMWEASKYWAERMVPSTNGDNTYECPNEYSPEHGPGSENATAHSQQLVNELFANTLDAIKILGNENSLESVWLEKVRDRAKKSDSGLRTEEYAASSNWGTTYLNYGEPILKEWKYSSFTAGANKHRHTSHLMALYPFNQVSYFSDQTTPEGKANYDLAVAARNSLAQRSDESTGWAMGWRVNLWARTLDGNHARLLINNALRHAGSGVYYNLWDSHSPFQIDGNFGVCAGISEMLIQSYDETIHLLPALPDAWADGSISGLKAVGNFTVSETWANKKLTEATVTSVMGGELRVQYGEEFLTMMTYPGETYNFYFDAEGHFASYLAGATIVNVVEHVKAALEGNDDLDGIDAAKNAVLGISGRK